MSRVHSAGSAGATPRRLLSLALLQMCAAGCIGTTQVEDAKAGTPPETAEALVSQLDSSDPRVRDQAEERLIRLGPAALPALTMCSESRDAEAAARARRALRLARLRCGQILCSGAISEPGKEDRRGLFRLDWDGGKPEYLGPEEHPSLAPDGRRLLLMRRQDRNFEAVLRDLVSGQETVLFVDHDWTETPVWDETGRQFAVGIHDTGYPVIVYDTESRGISRFPVGSSFGSGAVWEPGGKSLLIARYNRTEGSGGCIRISISHLERLNLSNGETTEVQPWDLAGAVAFNHDGSSLFTVMDIPQKGRDLIEVNSSTGEARLLGVTNPIRFGPVWSADGRALYVATEEQWTTTRVTVELFRIDPSTGESTIAGGGREIDLLCGLQPVGADGWFLATTWRGGHISVSLFDPESGELHPLHDEDFRADDAVYLPGIR